MMERGGTGFRSLDEERRRLLYCYTNTNTMKINYRHKGCMGLNEKSEEKSIDLLISSI